jgi:hypothetical protein
MKSDTQRLLTHGLGLVALLIVGGTTAANGQIPQDQYLRYVPLRYPRIISQTRASVRFHLYGDPESPTFRDGAPVDGIDDRRAEWLVALATRFAPIMVRNSSQFPMDFRAFYDQDGFSLYIEDWDIARASFSLVESERIDLSRLGDRPCPGTPPTATDNDDCRLLALIERFGPGRTPLESEAVAAPERELFSVLHLDLPGFDEGSWKREYGPKNRSRYVGARRVFAHPFIAEVSDENGGPAYELVLQFWFFYPANDGPNNHEGDWEHINVIVSPRSRVTAPLDAAAMAALLDRPSSDQDDDPLVIRRIEYYLHHYVTPLDFSAPNAYAPRNEWERQAAAVAAERGIGTRVLERVRRRAWRDEAETTINTRPIVWIGGDGIGMHNVLQMPGLKDRDGHASYPFRGYYKRIGAASVGERVLEAFDHVEYFADPTRSWHAVEDYGDPGTIALTPDWEHLLPLVRSDAKVRRDWSWLVLPLRFGYPASPSPVAGFVAHSDMGNVAVVGPAFNDGWNRLGDSAGYELYDLVEMSWARPLGLTDSFFPRLGFLNAPILYFMIKPPLDLIWRTAALPVRAAFSSRQPTFLPASAPASRAVSFEVGPVLTDVSDSFQALFFNRDQFPELVVILAILLPPDSGPLEITPHFGWAAAPAYQLVFHLSPRFSVESAFVHYQADVGFDVAAEQLDEPLRARGRLDQIDYQGALRFNLLTGSVQPYVKYGHGLTSYRLKDVNVNGVFLSEPDSPRFRPTTAWWNLGFNETILGGGVDWSRVRIGRFWLGAKASYTWIHHDIGFEREAAVETFPQLATLLAGTKFTMWRQQLRTVVTVGF